MTFGTVTRRFALSAALLASASMAQAGLEQPVKTAQGLVQGGPAKLAGVKVFKGIPFAAPPVGDLRFRAAQPPKAWNGVRDGTKWGDTCIQPSGKTRPLGINQAVDMPDSPAMSEDCLNLNVWTPAKAATDKLPVMVWFYGGAYAEGGNSMPFANGSNLAAKGAIVVSINYRVGAFGSLAHPELTAGSPHGASGNQMLTDAVAALKWVQANIAQFGGDPSNVTIFGQSAGSCISAALVGSPEAKGLFSKAISQSGAWAGLTAAKMVTREQAEQNTLAALDKLGIKSLAELQALPADKLAMVRNQGIMIDGWIVPEDLSKTFAAGAQNPVDVLLGSNGDEGSFTVGFGGPMTAERWAETAAMRWGTLAELGLKAYPVETDAQAEAFAPRPFTDGIAWFMRYYADLQTKIGKKAYLYQFVHQPPYEPGKHSLGASHASELAYMFGTLDQPREVPDASSPELASKSPVDIKLSDQMMTYWTNFAKKGDPNGAGLPTWPTADKMKPGVAMLLDGDTESAPGAAMTPTQMELYEKMFDRDVAMR